MKNALKGLAVTAICGLFFCASISAIRNIGKKRDAGDFAKAKAMGKAQEETKTEKKGEDMQDISKDFDRELINFLEESGYKTENYMVSPASLRAVLTLAVAGADKDTKTALIKAMGFDDEEEMNDWYEKVATAPDTDNFLITYKLLGSAWHNTASKGTITDNYKKKIKDRYGASAEDVSPEKITDEVNNWVNEGTEGLIPQISNDLSGVDMVLVNTLYLKSAWFNKFKEMATSEGDFTTFEDRVVSKDFMEKTDYFEYYEGSEGKLIILPLEGNVSAVFTLGDFTDVCDKLDEASEERVHIKLPKFDVETAFDKKEMMDFIKERGAGIAFTSDADFTVMSKDGQFYVSDIIQKTRIKVNEDGIEAAAASAVMVLGAAPPSLENRPKEFIADEPFRFYIITDTDKPEILFCGQIVK